MGASFRKLGCKKRREVVPELEGSQGGERHVFMLRTYGERH